MARSGIKAWLAVVFSLIGLGITATGVRIYSHTMGGMILIAAGIAMIFGGTAIIVASRALAGAALIGGGIAIGTVGIMIVLALARFMIVSDAKSLNQFSIIAAGITLTAIGFTVMIWGGIVCVAHEKLARRHQPQSKPKTP